jgi:hypothetical protein
MQRIFETNGGVCVSTVSMVDGVRTSSPATGDPDPNPLSQTVLTVLTGVCEFACIGAAIAMPGACRTPPSPAPISYLVRLFEASLLCRRAGRAWPNPEDAPQ